MKVFMTDNTFKNINFDYIFNGIRPITEYGIKVKQEAKPYKKGQEADLREEFNKIRAFIESNKRRDIIDVLKHVKNIYESIERARGNQVLDEVELFEIKNFLIQIQKLEKIIRGISSIKDLKLSPVPQLYNLLDPAEERLNTFYIYDEYSDNLRRIRKSKKETDKKIKILKKQIRINLEKNYNIKFNLKDEVTINKTEKDIIENLNKNKDVRVSGENYLSILFKITGNAEIYELENELVSLSAEEDDEEFKIRQNISREINSKYKVLAENIETVGRMDFIIAKANFAQKTGSIEPEVTSDLAFEIKGGRNLKLKDTLKQKNKEYVPIDLNLRKNVVCITGANMGGKTVSLRMIGQIAAAASYGMFVPCDYARLCLFDHIHISVGDDQSIEKGLSSFGAEIVNLKQAIDNSDERSLILIDELAGGTNPREGYAITRSVIDYLKKKESLTILTTHYDNVACDGDVLNLQVAGLKFQGDVESKIKPDNIDSISEYMDYRLIEIEYECSIPKDALRIARMAGINEEIIKGAENYL